MAMSGKIVVDLFVAYDLSVHCLSMNLFLAFQTRCFKSKMGLQVSTKICFAC